MENRLSTWTPVKSHRSLFLCVPYGARVVSHGVRKRDSLAFATSVEERDAFGRLRGALAWKQSLSSFLLSAFCLLLFVFPSPGEIVSNYKVQKLPGEVLDQQQQRGRRESAKSPSPRNHGNPQLGTKQTLLQHTRTHNTQNLPPPENAACYCCCCYTKEKKLRAQSVRGEEPGGVQLGAGLKNSPKHFHKLRFALIYTRCCCCCYFYFSSSVSKHSPERVGREPRKAKNQHQLEESVRWFRTTAASVAGWLR